MPNFNSIGSGVSEPQVAENRYLPLTGGIALTTVYALTCYTVIAVAPSGLVNFGTEFDHVTTGTLQTSKVKGSQRDVTYQQ